MMKSIKFALGLALLSINPIHAATIAWSSKDFTSTSNGAVLDSGIIATTGTLIFAENSGGSATTFDGIVFAAGTISFGSSAAVFYNDASPLADTGTFNSSAAGATVPLTGLISGNMYRVQVLMFDGRVGGNGANVRFDGEEMGVYGHGTAGPTWGKGMLVTGTFTADAITQNFNLEGNYGAAGGGTDINIMNGILLHQIPEPSAALLGCLGLLGLLRRRR